MPGTDSGASSAPVFSVIVPLEAHRGQWDRCWRGWAAQTVDAAAFEIIVVIPPDFQQFALLAGLPANFLQCRNPSHDTDPCAAGAVGARGRYLLFTEAHCSPEPDVLQLCLAAIDANAGWAGFSCATLPVTHNRLSQAEAAMYVADIEEAMLVHSWPRNLYQCFVTAREPYRDCGGFRPGLGQFSEWALAASYLQRGYRIGYFPQAKFHHYYSGSLKTVTDFTVNFVSGEMRYFGGERGEYFSALLEAPPEWACQANFDRDAARSLLRIAVQGLRPLRRDWRHFADSLARIARWASPALFGDQLVRLAATVSARCARLALAFAIAAGPRTFLDHRFRKYIAGLIKARRLATIADQRRARGSQPPSEHIGFDPGDFTLGACGFFPLETFQGSGFRWSETTACVAARVAAGPHEIRIDCIPVRDLSDPATDLRFYIDGNCIPNSRISIERHQVRVSLDNTGAARFRLGWTCARFSAAADPRLLGLPIERIELSAVPTPVTR